MPDATPKTRFILLLESFPTLKEHIRHYDRDTIAITALKGIAESAAFGSGVRAAASFLLFVWNGYHQEFDLHRAWSYWDDDHRAAWKAWARDPWWA